MTRGEVTQIKLHYKGANDDFIVFVDDEATYKQWLEDKSVPMAQFVSTFQVFVTHGQGKQGLLDTASKAILSAEFGTENVEEVIKKILTDGNAQTADFGGRQGATNDSMSSMRTK